jgi:hypothetical protein
VTVTMRLAEAEWHVVRQEVLPRFEAVCNCRVRAIDVPPETLVVRLRAMQQAGRMEIDLFAQDNMCLQGLVNTVLVVPFTPEEGQAEEAIYPSLMAVGVNSGVRYFLPLLFRLQSHRPGWPDVLDEHLVVLPHNPIDYSWEDLLLDRERRLLHRLPDARAKSLDSLEEPQFCGSLSPLLLDFSHPCPQPAPVVVHPSTSLRQFGQVDHLRLRGIKEPRHCPIEGRELALQAPAFLFHADIHCGGTAAGLVLCPQHGGLRPQRLHGLPDARLNQRRTAAAACARPWRLPRRAPGGRPALSMGPLCAGHSAHRPPDAATDTEAAHWCAAPALDSGPVALVPGPRSRERCAPAPGPAAMRFGGAACGPGPGRDGAL